MGNHTACAINLDNELSDLIKNETDRLKQVPMSDRERMEKLLDFIEKMSAQERFDIILRDQQFKSLKSTLDEAVLQYKGKLSYADALLGLIQTNTKSSKNARANLEQRVLSFKSQNLGNMLSELNNIDHYMRYDTLDVSKQANAELNSDILKEVARLNGANVASTQNNTALQYANAITKTQRNLSKTFKVLKIKESEAGSFTKLQTHNKNFLMKEGFETWHNFLLDNVDPLETPFVRNKKITQDIYNVLVGNAESFDFRQVPREFKPSVRRLLKDNDIVFADVSKEIDYLNTFGDPVSAMSTLGTKVDSASTKSAETLTFGTDPKITLERLTDYVNAKSDDKKKLKHSKVVDIYNEVLGRTGVGNEKVARIFRDIKKILGTALFGTTVVNSVMHDRMNGAFLKFSNDGGKGQLLFNLTKAIPEGVGDVGNIISKAIDFNKKGGFTQEEAIYLNKLGLGLSSILSQSNRMFDEVNDLGQGQGFGKMVDGLTKFFSKASGLEIMDNMQTKNYFTQHAYDTFLALNKQNWDKLTTGEIQKLTRYGINKKEYDILKTLVGSIEIDPVLNEKIFNPLYVRDLTRKQLAPLAEPILKEQQKYARLTGVEFDEVYINNIYSKIKLDLENKIRTYYNGETHITLGKKDSRANFFTRGTKSGTFGGEITRIFMQAKTYPLLYLDNIAKNIYYSTALETKEKTAGFIAFASYSLLAGVLLEQVNQIKKFKSPQEIDKDLIMRGFARSGVAGLYGDALSGIFGDVFDYSKETGFTNKANLYRNLVNLAGVLPSKTADILEGMNNVIAKKSDPDKLIKSIKGAMPLNNLYYLDGSLAYLTLAISEALGGKGLKKERRRLRKEGREFLIDPLA
jgi:hypothetical protein